METHTDAAETAPSRKRSILANLKGLGFTLLVLAALWVGLRYVLTPIMLPKEAPIVQEAVSYETRIQILEEKIAALENRGTTATSDLAPLEARIAALEQANQSSVGDAMVAIPPVDHEAIDALKAEVNALKSTEHTAVRSLILIGQLQDALRTGRPFGSELAALSALRPSLKEMLSEAEPYSTTGVFTLARLQEQFSRSIAPALAPTEGKSLTRNLKSLVSIRKIGESQKGTDDEAILARAEAKLSKGDVADALQETRGLSPNGASHFSGWQKQATLFLSAQELIAKLQLEMTEGPHE